MLPLLKLDPYDPWSGYDLQPWINQKFCLWTGHTTDKACKKIWSTRVLICSWTLTGSPAEHKPRRKIFTYKGVSNPLIAIPHLNLTYLPPATKTKLPNTKVWNPFKLNWPLEPLQRKLVVKLLINGEIIVHNCKERQRINNRDCCTHQVSWINIIVHNTRSRISWNRLLNNNITCWKLADKWCQKRVVLRQVVEWLSKIIERDWFHSIMWANCTSIWCQVALNLSSKYIVVGKQSSMVYHKWIQ